MAPEVLAFVALLGFANLHLLGLADPWKWTFLPASVLAGEWWRLLTHPFLHVSAYHLALDGAAFLLLYTGLREPRRAHRLGYMLAAGVGSLFVSLWVAPVIWNIGLCGLSGIAHGLMAVTSLELIGARTPTSAGPRCKVLYRLGWLCFIGVVGKCVLEIALGGALIAAWHLGSVGFPVVVCHAGGVLGALVAWLLISGQRR
ncbi:MAG: hypothetical protein RL514_4473 [Verrucomicrobiota bacterium]|jgi:rhomboid family GlyGly-CTERM serine protease